MSSFGGDQFELDDEKNTATFFDVFYWAINAGSLISTFSSPIIRQMTCGAFGTKDSCYFLAFGIPALLMVVAVFMFVFGTKHYIQNPPSGQNIFWDCIRCIWYGAWNKVPENAPGDHWLYGAYGKVDDWLIRDTKYLVRVLIMAAPLIIFWAAFDMQGSRWVLEAVRMNAYITDSFRFLPDQIQMLNAVFVLALIPIFNLGYGWVDKCLGKGFVTRLRKIATGMDRF